MSFAKNLRRVERCEQLLEGRLDQVRISHAELSREWRQALTPPRIVISGLLAGFVTGRAQPEKALRKLGSLATTTPKLMQLAGSLTGLIAAVQARLAAGEETASDPDTEAPTRAATTPEPAQPAPPRRRRPDPAWSEQPAAAEAATDLSEIR